MLVANTRYDIIFTQLFVNCVPCEHSATNKGSREFDEISCGYLFFFN